MESNLTLPGPSNTLSRIHETSAKFQRYKILLRRRWWFLLLTASIGVCVMALKITGQPQSFTSLAKLVAGGRVVGEAGGHQQAADVGEAEAERAVAVAEFSDLA